MKIKCIKNYGLVDLTIGKIYYVLNKDYYWYWIINDESGVFWYPKEWFRPLSEIRNETINKLLEDES